MTPSIHKKFHLCVRKKIRKCKRRVSASRQLFYVIFDDKFNKLVHKAQCHKLKCFFFDSVLLYQDIAYVFFFPIFYAVFIWLLIRRRSWNHQLAKIEFICDEDGFYFHSNEITTITIALGNWGWPGNVLLLCRQSSLFTEQIKPWFLYYKT